MHTQKKYKYDFKRNIAHLKFRNTTSQSRFSGQTELYKDEMASAPNRSTSQKDYLKVVWKTSRKLVIQNF